MGSRLSGVGQGVGGGRLRLRVRAGLILLGVLSCMVGGVSGSAHRAGSPGAVSLGAVSPGAASQGAAQAPAAAQSPDPSALPADPDTDGDGMPDAWETFFGLLPNDLADAAADPDTDGLTNLQEYQQQSHPVGRFARYFAEGSTGSFFDTSIGLINPSTTDVAHISLAFLSESGVAGTHQVTLQPRQRQTVSVDDVLGPAGGAVGTIVESDVAIGADRLVTWGANGYGSTTDSGEPAPATTWYLAEGSTGLFEMYLLLLNPGLAPANVTVKYLREVGAPITKSYTVPARSRATVFVNTQDLGLLISSLGAVVTSTQPIVVERSMFFSILTLFGAGTGGSGVPQLSTQWHFAEGATGPFFDEFLALLNPSTQPVTATVTYRLTSGVTLTKNYTIDPERRRTIYLNLEAQVDPALAPLADASLWVTVDSTLPIAAERVMWWPHTFLWNEGAASHGTIAPGTSFVIPEGSTGGPHADQTYVLIANTSAAAGQVRLTLIEDGGAATARVLSIGPLRRLSVNVGAEFALGTSRFSLLVESLGSPLPLVVDYSRYSSPGGMPFGAGGGTVAMPIAAPAPGDQAPTVTATTPANNATDVAIDADLTITFSEPVDVTATAFTIACPAGTPVTFTSAPASPATAFTLDPDNDLPVDTTCTVTVAASQVTDADTTDPPDTMAADYVFTFTTGACPTVDVQPTSLPSAVPGTPYSQAFTQTGGTAPIAWSLTGALPTGVAFDSATGVLSGTPTATGSFPVTVTATDASGCAGAVSVTLAVSCPTITVTPAALPAATTGTPFSQAFAQTGATGGVTWSLSGALPTGVTFNTATGELSGTPTEAGSFAVTVTATDANGCAGAVTVTLAVSCPTIAIDPATLPGGTTGTLYPSTQFTQAGGSAPIVWDLESGTLPTGLSLTSGGLLSGTPTDDGTFAFRIRGTDVYGCAGALSYSVSIVCPTITVTTSGPVPNGTVGTPYAGVTFQQAGGATPIAWSVTAGALPTGVTLSPTTGELTGAPTQIGTFTVTVTATDANGCTGSLQVTFDVVCPTITVGPAGPTLPDGLFNAPYSQMFTASGGATPHTFSFTGALPPGLTLASNGALSGSPSNTGLFNFTVMATDSSTAACTGQTSYSVTVRPNAQPETYSGAVGNTELIVDATPSIPGTPAVVLSGSVLLNDQGPATLTAGPVAIPTIGGGAVAMGADGAFQYQPATGFTGPTDGFTYTLTDGNGITNSAAVTINLGGMVWYVNNTAGGSGDGRSHNPFNSLASAESQSAATHAIFVHSGTGTTAGDGTITLDQNQTIWGQGAAFTLGGLTIPGGAAPIIGDTIAVASGALVNSLTVNSGANPAITIGSAMAGTATINAVAITGGSTGLTLNDVGGQVVVTGSSIGGVTGADVLINQGTGNVSVGATVTNTAGRSVDIQNHAGGLITLTGSITDTGAGIHLANNAGSEILFTGGLTLATGASPAFVATGGGTVGVPPGVPSTIATTTATALEVTNTTIDPAGLRFQSISAGTVGSGPLHGVVLTNTGAGGGGLTVTGTGAPNSGGTIQNTTGNGILLSGTTSPAFTSVRILNTGGSAIKGTQVTNFTFVNGTIDNSNDDGTLDVNESNIAFNDAVTGTENNLSGDVVISGNTLTDALYHGVDILNHAGALGSVNISTNTITSGTTTGTGGTSFGSGIRLIAFGSASTAASVTSASIADNIITNFPGGAGIVVQGGNADTAGGAPSGAMGIAGNPGAVVAITGNRIAGESSTNRMGTNAIQAAVNGRGQGNFQISNNGTVANPITDITGNVISHSSLGLANVTSTIANNVIVANHTAGVGGAFGISVGSGQTIGIGDTALLTTTIQGNTISETDGNGIIAAAREGHAAVNARILDNNVAAPLGGVRPGIRVESGGGGGTVDANVCLEISGNTSDGTGGTTQGIGLRKEGADTAVHAFGIVGLSPAPAGTPDVEIYVNGLNPAANETLLIASLNGFTACTIP